MQEKIQQKTADYLAKNHRRRTWKKVVSALACMVVFCTTYALILPAITLENHTAYCGFEAHQHSLECHEKTLICGQEETGDAVHVHTDECYEWVLKCNKEDHTHELSCYSNPETDVESAEDWSRSVSCVELTGNWRNDLVAVAESQLGYTESSRNYMVDEDGETKKGYTRYGAWYGEPYGDWNAMFASFCLHYAGISAEAFPQDVSCSRWAETLQKEEYDFYRAKENYAPKAGDLIFFDSDGDGRANRVGIVAQLTEDAQGMPGKLKIIEGNSDNCVQYVAYNLDDASILGYSELPKEPRVEYRWSQDGMEVLMSVPQDEELPKNASLVVKRLTPENDESGYKEKYAASQEVLAAENAEAISYFDLFQVSLQAEGKEVLPQKEATVEIRLLEDEYPVTSHMEFYHYSEDGTAVPASDLREESGSLIGSFDTEFSGTYAVVGAADFASEAPSARAAEAREVSSITPHKTIDAFRDGTNNPDTTLDNTATDKTDLYRLYLDAAVKGEGNPIDLLIVVDESGSMETSDMEDKEGNSISREAAIRQVLNGTANSADYEENKANGFIYKFLKMNPANKAAVIGFYGSRSRGFKGYISDAGELKGWASGADTFGYVNVTSPSESAAPGGQRTNYCAGLRLAEDYFSEVKNDGNKKVMLFLSDGIPTYYMTDDSNRGGTGLPYATLFDDNPATCSKETINYFNNQFYPSHKNVTIYTMGIFPGTDGNGEYSTSSKVLKHMATEGGGQFLSTSNTDEVQNAMWQFIKKSAVTALAIEDDLSRYVDVYEDQPDFKLTMTDENGSSTTLWENGSATAAGENIVQSVGYEGKNVTAVFNPTYHPLLDYIYTLSFNVKTTQTAYEEYVKNGYQGVIGESGTDYGGNTTSSGQPGFHSNALAVLRYHDGEKQVTLQYPHPVVQAVTCKAAIQKTDSRDTSKKLSGAEFTLYRKAFTGETGDTLDGLDGSYVMIDQQLTTDKNGQLIIDNLIPGDYCLVETKAPEHYKKLTDPVSFTFTRKTDGTGQIEGSDLTITVDGETLPALWITNMPWDHDLPMTGGTGATPYIIGGLLLISAGVLMLYIYNKRRKEDSASS